MGRQNADAWYLFVIMTQKCKMKGVPKKATINFLTLDPFWYFWHLLTILDTIHRFGPFGQFRPFWTLFYMLDTFAHFGHFDIFGHFERFWTLFDTLDAFGHFGRFWTLLEDFGQFYWGFFWDTRYMKVMYATSPSPIPEYWVTWAWGYHHPPVTTIVDSLNCKLSLSFFRVASLTLFL